MKTRFLEMWVGPYYKQTQTLYTTKYITDYLQHPNNTPHELWNSYMGLLGQLRSTYNAPTEPIFKTLKLLNIQDIFKLQTLKFYYKLINDSLPIYFNHQALYDIL